MTFRVDGVSASYPQWQRSCCCDGRSVGKLGPGRVVCGVPVAIQLAGCPPLSGGLAPPHLLHHQPQARRVLNPFPRLLRVGGEGGAASVVVP